MAKAEFHGSELTERLTLVLDESKLEREAFGIFKWRLRVAKQLLALAVRVLHFKSLDIVIDKPGPT